MLLNEIQNSQHVKLGPAQNPYTQHAAAETYLLGIAEGRGRSETCGWHRAAGSHLCLLLLPSLQTASRKLRGKTPSKNQTALLVTTFKKKLLTMLFFYLLLVFWLVGFVFLFVCGLFVCCFWVFSQKYKNMELIYSLSLRG